MSSIDPIAIVTSIVALLIAIVGHEIMHGWVAYKYGDMTAKQNGRLSINPLVHLDPIGSILVPIMTYYLPVLLLGTTGFLFGWAKPVPVNMQTVIRNGGYNAAMQVSLAGIVYNLFLATLFSIILTTLYSPEIKDTLFIQLTWSLIQINVVLAVLNLLPIPSFDGAHFVTYVALKFRVFKVAEFFAKAEPYGMIVIILILMTPLKIPLLIWPVSTLLNLLLS